MTGRGWDKNLWAEGRWPTRDDLDTVAGGRPVALTSKDGHLLWVNSAALARAARQNAVGPRRVRLAEAFVFKAPLACLLPVKLVTDEQGNQTGIGQQGKQPANLRFTQAQIAQKKHKN